MDSWSMASLDAALSPVTSVADVRRDSASFRFLKAGISITQRMNGVSTKDVLEDLLNKVQLHPFLSHAVNNVGIDWRVSFIFARLELNFDDAIVARYNKRRMLACLNDARILRTTDFDHSLASDSFLSFEAGVEIFRVNVAWTLPCWWRTTISAGRWISHGRVEAIEMPVQRAVIACEELTFSVAVVAPTGGAKDHFLLDGAIVGNLTFGISPRTFSAMRSQQCS